MGVKNLRKQFPYLQTLEGEKSAKKRKQILEAGGTPLIHCLSECCLNLLKGNLKLSKSDIHKLHRHANKIRKLGEKKVSNKEKKKIIQQGGFLPALLPVIISAVGSLLGGLSR